jgi:hypothetical protein
MNSPSGVSPMMRVLWVASFAEARPGEGGDACGVGRNDVDLVPKRPAE